MARFKAWSTPPPKELLIIIVLAFSGLLDQLSAGLIIWAALAVWIGGNKVKPVKVDG